MSGDESSDDDDGDDEIARVQVAYTRGRQDRVPLDLDPDIEDRSPVRQTPLDRVANRTTAMLPFRYTLSKVSCACQRLCKIGRNVSPRCAGPDEVIKAASGFKLKEDLTASFSTRLFYHHQLVSKGTIVASRFHPRSSKPNEMPACSERSGSRSNSFKRGSRQSRTSGPDNESCWSAVQHSVGNDGEFTLRHLPLRTRYIMIQRVALSA